jgi:hypothetical protein
MRTSKTSKSKARPALDGQPKCIAYLSASKNILYVSAKYRMEIAQKWDVKSPSDKFWPLADRPDTVTVVEVKGFVGGTIMEDKEGDTRVRTGCKCTKDYDKLHTDCKPESEFLTTYDYQAYSECAKSESDDDKCEETYTKIGQQHSWRAACLGILADLDVFKWVCKH